MGEKAKIRQVGKGEGGKNRARGSRGVAESEGEAVVQSNGLFSLTLENTGRKGKRNIQATANVNEQGCEKQKGTDI